MAYLASDIPDDVWTCEGCAGLLPDDSELICWSCNRCENCGCDGERHAEALREEIEYLAEEKGEERHRAWLHGNRFNF